MTNPREKTLDEIALNNVSFDLELGTDLLELRVLEAAQQAALLVKDLIALQDS